MGLHATIEFDYPTETPILGIPVDYGDALDEFCDVFEDYATYLVPVDTGYLQSTISSINDGEITAECFADAEYAQYVEYGTWKMAAQPYFEPAIIIAMNEAEPIFQDIWMEALQEEQEQLEEMEEEFEGDSGGIGGGFGLLGMIFTAAIIGIVKGVISAFKEATDTKRLSRKIGSYRSYGGELPFDIDIT